MPSGNEMLRQVQNYRKIVLIYEGLNAEIHKLLEANTGGTEFMSPEDVQRYRELARQRDEMMSEMRWLEQQLLESDDDIVQ